MDAVACGWKILEDRSETRDVVNQKFVRNQRMFYCHIFAYICGAVVAAAMVYATVAAPFGREADIPSAIYKQERVPLDVVPVSLHVGSQSHVKLRLPPQMMQATTRAVCTAKPVLPVGLKIDSSTCTIHGIPRQLAAAHIFTVTTANPEVTVGAKLSLTVEPGKAHVVAGGEKPGQTFADWQPGLRQMLHSPSSLFSHLGRLYIGQKGSIAQLDIQSGKVKLFVELAETSEIVGMIVVGDDLIFADVAQAVVGKVGLVGSSNAGFISHVADIAMPWGLALLDGDWLLISDSGNHCIHSVRLIGEDAATAVVAGSFGVPGLSGDGASASLAKMSTPKGILVIGRVAFVADSMNGRIRTIDFEQNPPVIETFAGGGQRSIDGTPALEWKLDEPISLSFSVGHQAIGKETMYVTSSHSHTVVAIDLQQEGHPVTVMAGVGVQGWGPYLTTATKAALSSPSAVAAVGDSICIAENHCIVCLPVSSPPTRALIDPPQELADNVSLVVNWT